MERTEGPAPGLGWHQLGSGHDGILGNKLADTEAKIAVSRGSSCTADLLQALWGREFPCTLMAAAAAFKKELNVQWKATWGKSPRHVRVAKIDDKMPSHSFIMVTDELTRVQASVLT